MKEKVKKECFDFIYYPDTEEEARQFLILKILSVVGILQGRHRIYF